MTDQNVLPTGKVSKNNGNSMKPAVLQADHALGISLLSPHTLYRLGFR